MKTTNDLGQQQPTVRSINIVRDLPNLPCSNMGYALCITASAKERDAILKLELNGASSFGSSNVIVELNDDDEDWHEAARRVLCENTRFQESIDLFYQSSILILYPY